MRMDEKRTSRNDELRREYDISRGVRGKYARFTLRQLLRRVTKGNIHEEADWGRATGREAW
jgi:antitoxin component of MazEF toxin-antitoxin module